MKHITATTRRAIAPAILAGALALALAGGTQRGFPPSGTSAAAAPAAATLSPTVIPPGYFPSITAQACSSALYCVSVSGSHFTPGGTVTIAGYTASWTLTGSTSVTAAPQYTQICYWSGSFYICRQILNLNAGTFTATLYLPRTVAGCQTAWIYATDASKGLSTAAPVTGGPLCA